MPITQAQKDGIVGKVGELETLVNALVADQPAQQVPPPTANTYISASHPGSLTSTDKGGSLAWNMFGTDAATGLTKFWANGTSQTQVLGTKLVLQDSNAYAKQPDGSWLMGTRFGPAKVTVAVVDPAP